MLGCRWPPREFPSCLYYRVAHVDEDTHSIGAGITVTPDPSPVYVLDYTDYPVIGADFEGLVAPLRRFSAETNSPRSPHLAERLWVPFCQIGCCGESNLECTYCRNELRNTRNEPNGSLFGHQLSQ